MLKSHKKNYVDDLNTGVNSVKQGVELVKKNQSAVQFNVRKFRSSSKELRTYFDRLENANNVNNAVYKQVGDSKIDNEQKILGCIIGRN